MGAKPKNASRAAWLTRLLVMLLALLAATAASAIDVASSDPARPPGKATADYWREVRQGVPGVTQVKGGESAVMINTEGQRWRNTRNGPLKRYGGTLVLVMAGIIGLFYLLKGPMRLHSPPTGRKIARFTPFERFAHWGTAIIFVLMALTGLAILFARSVLGPAIGTGGLSGLLSLGKLLHNYLGPLFLAFTLLLILTFLRDNIWQKGDGVWILKAGGLFSGGHVPSGRFNFGEKTWFWLGVTALGLIVAGSGLVLDFALVERTRETMQLATLIHATAAVVLVMMSLGHIYMGTLGVEGAYQSMKTGEVDETWAREHHQLWYDDIKAGKSGHP